MSEDFINTSGQGKDAFVLDIVGKRFNWGAFFFSWILGICNNTWITLIALAFPLIVFILGIIFTILGAKILLSLMNPFILIIGLAMQIWFGIKGNRWAWQNKRWESIEAFHKTQRIWAIVGVVLNVGLFGLGFVGAILALTLPVLISNTQTSMMDAATKKHQVTVAQVITLNKALESKCKKDSVGLAKCFAQHMNVVKEENNIIELSDGAIYEFTGDGQCNSNHTCYAVIYPLGKTTKSGRTQNSFNIYFKSNSDGYIETEE